MSPTITRLALTIALSLSAAGCTTYASKPLPTQAPAAASRLSELRGAPQDPNAPLTLEQLQQLVLENNPDLAAAQDRRAVAGAQVKVAGILPNPTLSGGLGYLLSGAGEATAWSADLSQDIRSLITYSAHRQAAHADADAVDATLVWEQWQTLAKARLLFVDLVQGHRIERAQERICVLMDERAMRLRNALATGATEKSAVTPYLTAAVDAHTQLNDTRARLLKQHHELAALLGAAPEIPLALSHAPLQADLDPAQVAGALDDLPRRRPDLVALRLGYDAAEANLRAEVLSQFPLLDRPEFCRHSVAALRVAPFKLYR